MLSMLSGTTQGEILERDTDLDRQSWILESYEEV